MSKIPHRNPNPSSSLTHSLNHLLPDSLTHSSVFRRGQVVAEYFILFAVVALLTLIGLTRFEFSDDIKTSLEGFVNAAANAIAN